MNIIANLPEESDVFQLLDQQTRSESTGSFISEGSESRARSKSAQIVEEVISMGAKIIQSENQTDSLNVKEISSSRSNATESSRMEEIVSNPTSQINESCEVKSVETSKSEQRNNDTVNETADSLTRRVRDVLTMPPPGSGKFHSNSAMDSIEVKSVSSTTSSKFGFENKQFESTDLWRFVKQFIPADQEEIVKNKMMSEMQNSNASIHSKATSNTTANNSLPPTLTLSQLQTRNTSAATAQNKSGKSIVSEQRFVDGLVYSPVGSHKSSTPDHSLISGWKYTRDSDFITGNIKVAESESDQAKSSTSSQSYSKSSQMSAISTSSGASASADELSQRVRNLLKEIDTSLDESEGPKMTPKLPKLILDIEQTQDAFRREIRRTQSSKFGGHQVADKSSSQERSFSNRSIATPRSIEDLTTDEKYGSFMPASSHMSHPSHTSHSPNYQTCLQDVEDVELEEGELEDSTQEDEDLETYQTTVESQKKIIDVVENFESTVTDTLDIRETLEKEQRECISRKTAGISPETTQQTETEPLKSEDAEAPSFPSEVYGSRVDDETLNKTPSSLYQKKSDDKTRNHKSCRNEVNKNTNMKLSPVPSCAPSVRIREVEDSVDSIKVTDFETPKNISEIHKSVVVRDVETTLEQTHEQQPPTQKQPTHEDGAHNETASSVGSFYCPWFPKNMKEFKKLSRDQKREFVRILKKAAKKKHEMSGISDVSSMSSVSSIDLDVVFSKYPKQKMQEMNKHEKISSEKAHQSSSSIKDRSRTPYEQPNEEQMTQKIIAAIKVDVQKTIKEEIKKIYPNAPPNAPPSVKIDQPRMIHSSIGVGQKSNSPRIVKAASEITHTLDSSANKGN